MISNIQLTSTIDKWIDIIDQFSFDQLLQKPDKESWSIGQVAMHIHTETSYYLMQVEQCLSNYENSNGSMKDEGKQMFENNSFPDIRIQRGHNLSQDYPQPESKEDLKSRFLELKKQLGEALDRISSINRSGKTQHPGLGYFNAKEWLQFAEMHMRHHLGQVDRIIKNNNH